MLLNLSIRNFGSIKDLQTLSLVANRSDHLSDQYIIEQNGYRVLKFALIYGANASGKTTVLSALDFIKRIVLRPNVQKTDELDFSPFLFDPVTPKEASYIGIEFLWKNIRYEYEIEFTRKAVLNETLTYYKTKKAELFTRQTDLSNQFAKIKFGSKIKVESPKRRSLEANTLWNNTVLGGFLKTNVDIPELGAVVEWFKVYLKSMVYTKTDLEAFVTAKISSNEIEKTDVLEILSKADFNIHDLSIAEEEQDMPEELWHFLKSQIEGQEELKKRLDQGNSFTVRKLEFQHRVNNTNYSLPFEKESHGTKRYYGFAGMLALLINESIALPIDELEASLHPDLFNFFILSFLTNSKQSQIIATTHNRELLNDKSLFRNDAIWFTNKGKDSATELYSLSDFTSETIRDSTNVWKAYKVGRLKATPNTSDIYLNLDFEEEVEK